MSPGQKFCTTVFYSSLPSVWYATWLCLYKMDFGPFGATPASSVPRGYIKIPNVFLQSTSIGLLPVTVSRFYLRKAEEELCDNQKKDPKSSFWPLVTPRHAPGQKFPSTWYATWLCLYKMDFLTLRGHTSLALPLGVTSKFRMCSSNPHP